MHTFTLNLDSLCFLYISLLTLLCRISSFFIIRADITTLSIDSGDIDTVARYAKTGLITDATTNPLFVSQAGANGDARYEVRFICCCIFCAYHVLTTFVYNFASLQAMVAEAVAYAKRTTCSEDGCPVPEETLNKAIDRLAVNLGKELVSLVPGRVSTEVDIRLSYDTEKSVERARSIIAMYQEEGISKDRILIKLAGTWGKFCLWLIECTFAG